MFFILLFNTILYTNGTNLINKLKKYAIFFTFCIFIDSVLN